jgi:glycosyltransferase involved in cell wall biosynthesis
VALPYSSRVGHAGRVIALSVIVPVYGVERYLSECIDSLLSEAPDDLEVIAVNDASPDGSGEILAKYAARDARVRVITLERNGGLSAARNTGLDRARGRYVWFVDGDDWLPPGTTRAVVERLAQANPDVLIVDYARVYPDGREEAFSPTDSYPEPLPDTFTLADRPALLRSLHIACNKVVRREFLLDSGIRFVAGWYEDVSFSIPLMLSASRLSVLNRVSYGYRQRPEGSITSTVTERHFEVFPQWERVFAYLDEHPERAGLRAAVFARMMWHLLAVLSKPDRVPPARRRAFFAEMTRVYRLYRPADGYPVPSGATAISHRFVDWGTFRLYESTRAAELTRRRLGRGVVDAARAVRARMRRAGRP